MPRVNRDLQRRMAARRERERRRPSGERRYQFPQPESAPVEPDETEIEENGEAVETPTRPARRPTAAPRSATPRTAARPAAKPFSAYKEEYAYVYGDLRRVGVVIGSLLAVLIVLYFVLPLLVH